MIESPQLEQFIYDLRQSGFDGDIETSYSERVSAATDNSIYQWLPLALFYPRSEEDIDRVAKTLAAHKDKGFSLCARGGATGTNGQSLTDSLVLDCSRYLNRIIDFDPDKRTVTLQPGVVLDQLNAFLEPHGLFFPIDISSSSRATLGGMVATDASGKGSLIYGKTSDHIKALDVVLADGTQLDLQDMSLDDLVSRESHLTELLHSAYQRIENEREEIDRVFPDIDRGMTGYDLKNSIAEKNRFNPCFLLSGSEGTLALTRRITLRIIPRPSHRLLSVVFYSDFQRGLEHVPELLQCQPAAIEMLDDKILALARDDSVWLDVQAVLENLPSVADVRAANFIEFLGHSDEQIEQYQQRMVNTLEATANSFAIICHQTVSDANIISALWELRKRAVGLLGQADQGKRGIAFVEDSAVPTQNLAAYVSDFRRVLDAHGLDYGMYGHADAGVLHVRPKLDLLQAGDRQLIRGISNQVAELCLKHGGVMWGEHGRGLRGEFNPRFFGDRLYRVMCDIKKLFDPFNLLNPGKLAAPVLDTPLIRLDEVDLRADYDSRIQAHHRSLYQSSLDCNGNGVCHSWDQEQAMCPSYKATRNKRYSPRGRAALIREWLRLEDSKANPDQLHQLESSLFDSLQFCLSCKSCSYTCPLKVDIPEMKSRFLQTWYSRHPRPLSAFFIRHFETLIGLGSRLPRFTNFLLGITQRPFAAISGLNRLPRFSTDRQAGDHRRSVTEADVVLMRDNYLNSFDRPTMQAAVKLLDQLGYRAALSSTINSGKLLHVKGYREAFAKRAQQVVNHVNKLSQSGVPVLSLETIIRQMFGHEYPDILQKSIAHKPQSLESFLLAALRDEELQVNFTDARPVTLLPHCSEQTGARESQQHWQEIFGILGVPCHIINAGCCGMSGLFGHERKNIEMSESIFSLRWKTVAENNNNVLLATGFSCRCQLKNHGHRVLHPVQYLTGLL